MGKISAQAGLISPTPHIDITSPVAGASFKGATQPDMIPVNGTVFLTCDDPGGDCGPGRISSVTVKLGASDAKAATLTLDATPAPGNEQSGSWQFTGVPGPAEVNAMTIIATVNAFEGPRRPIGTASTSVLVNITNEGGRTTCAQLVQRLNLLNSLLAHVHDPGRLEEIAQERNDIIAQQQRQGCIHPSVVATLTGTAMVSTDRNELRGPFASDVSLEVVFSGDQVSIGPININVSGVHAVSDGGIGTFDHSSGLMKIPVQVRADKNGITLNLSFTLSTESGEAHGPFTPHGVRLGSDGSMTLAGAAFDTVFGTGVNVLLVISGIVSPLP